MPWLVRDGKVLAGLEVADSRRSRRRGLLGREGLDGAMLLRPAKAVHTVRMRFPIDVAYCADGGDEDRLVVLKVRTMERNRVGLPLLRARCVLETEAGVMRAWGVRSGDVLEVRGLAEPSP